MSCAPTVKLKVLGFSSSSSAAVTARRGARTLHSPDTHTSPRAGVSEGNPKHLGGRRGMRSWRCTERVGEQPAQGLQTWAGVCLRVGAVGSTKTQLAENALYHVCDAGPYFVLA